MFELIRSAAWAVRLRLLLRRQDDSLKLRRIFRSRFDVEVGLYSYGCFDPWRMPGPMRVGRYCSIARSARVAPMNHPSEALTTHPVLYERRFGAVDHDLKPDRPLVIEDDVWIGHGATILPRCRFIGRGAVIGAGSVVTRDVEPYTVVAGNPARKLRDRFPREVAAAIEATRWWELEMSALADLARTRPDLVRRPEPEALRAWRSLPA